MAKPVRRQGMLRAMFPDLPEPRTAVLAFSSAQTFRVEELVRDNHYVIRAGFRLNPAKDIEVIVDGSTWAASLERWPTARRSQLRTEFRYGSLTRSVRLPAQVGAPDITARYQRPGHRVPG